MVTFIAQHGGEMVVCLVLLLIVGAIIVRMVRDRRAGKGGCGCNCGGCPNAGTCHPETAKK